MQEIISYIVDKLVKDKDASSVELINDKIIITVAKEDMGSVIGRNGRVAKAIRTLARTLGHKEGGVRYQIDILNTDERKEYEEKGSVASAAGVDDGEE